MPVAKFSRRNALSSLLGASGLATTFIVGTQIKAKAENTPTIIEA